MKHFDVKVDTFCYTIWREIMLYRLFLHVLYFWLYELLVLSKAQEDLVQEIHNIREEIDIKLTKSYLDLNEFVLRCTGHELSQCLSGKDYIIVIDQIFLDRAKILNCAFFTFLQPYIISLINIQLLIVVYFIS